MFTLVYNGVCLAVFGAVLGSYLDCMVWRWVNEGRPYRGRSHCAGCGRLLTVRDLIPIFSYLHYRGRCRTCGAKIPAECLIAELAGAAIFAGLAVRFDITLQLGMWLLPGVLLLLVLLTSLDAGTVPAWVPPLLTVNRLIWLFFLKQPLPGFLLDVVLAWLPVLALLLLTRPAGRMEPSKDARFLLSLTLYLTWPGMLFTLALGTLLTWLHAYTQKTAPRLSAFLALSAVAAACLF